MAGDERISSVTPKGWEEANQGYLSAALAVVRAHLSRHAERFKGETAVAEKTKLLEKTRNQLEAAEKSASSAPALKRLCALFGLSPFERDIVLLCAGMELEATFGPLCGAAQGDPQRAFPTFGLALAVLPDAHWSALLPSAPLRHWRLVGLVGTTGFSGAPLTTSPLRIDERVLHFLTGVQHLDERLAGMIEPVTGAHQLMPSHQAVAERVTAAWSPAVEKFTVPVILLNGPDPAAARDIAFAACAVIGLSLHAIPGHAVPANPNDFHVFLRIWEREAALSGSALFVDCDDDEFMEAGRAGVISDLIERMHTPLVVSSRERRRTKRRSVSGFDVPRPAAREQYSVWSAALGGLAQQFDGQLQVLISQFSLSTSEILSAAGAARNGADTRAFENLWDACRSQSRTRLDSLAQKIEPAASWDDLVLPEMQKNTLNDIVAHVRQRAKVYETWGFASKGSRGLGISALFAGASGTGKTMAAEVLARTLRLDLFRIDLSSVVSKYIGETEKSLRRIFDAAEAGGAILLFDEADALFGKRSEVKDSHDRYANIEVSYLLQRMECYRGLAILTTNMKSALDTAFLRRIRFVVQFPFPDAAQRAEIWRRIFPISTPTSGLDIGRLAQLNVSGGNIRNIALNAAFLAADAEEKVGMSHVLRAAHSEYAKIEKPLTDAETAGWTYDGGLK